MNASTEPIRSPDSGIKFGDVLFLASIQRSSLLRLERFLQHLNHTYCTGSSGLDYGTELIEMLQKVMALCRGVVAFVGIVMLYQSHAHELLLVGAELKV